MILVHDDILATHWSTVLVLLLLWPGPINGNISRSTAMIISSSPQEMILLSMFNRRNISCDLSRFVMTDTSSSCNRVLFSLEKDSFSCNNIKFMIIFPLLLEIVEDSVPTSEWVSEWVSEYEWMRMSEWINQGCVFMNEINTWCNTWITSAFTNKCTTFYQFSTKNTISINRYDWRSGNIIEVRRARLNDNILLIIGNISGWKWIPSSNTSSNKLVRLIACCCGGCQRTAANRSIIVISATFFCTTWAIITITFIMC